jgi:hypothetical protein
MSLFIALRLVFQDSRSDAADANAGLETTKENGTRQDARGPVKKAHERGGSWGCCRGS